MTKLFNIEEARGQGGHPVFFPNGVRVVVEETAVTTATPALPQGVIRVSASEIAIHDGTNWKKAAFTTVT